MHVGAFELIFVLSFDCVMLEMFFFVASWSGEHTEEVERGRMGWTTLTKATALRSLPKFMTDKGGRPSLELIEQTMAKHKVQPGSNSFTLGIRTKNYCACGAFELIFVFSFDCVMLDFFFGIVGWGTHRRSGGRENGGDDVE